MHEEVHDDEPAGWSRVLAEGVPAVDEDGDVVIPVEEYQLLFPQHDEDGVSQLGDLHTASETSLVFHVLTHLQDKFRAIWCFNQQLFFQVKEREEFNDIYDTEDDIFAP